MDREEVEELAMCLANVIKKEVGEEGLDLRLHVDGPNHWWINTGLSDYDSVHGKWIAADTLYPDTDPEEMARKLWDDIEEMAHVTAITDEGV